MIKALGTPVLSLVSASAIALAACCGAGAGIRQVPEGLAEFEAVKDQAVPAVCEMTGLSSGGLIKIDMITRAEVLDLMRRAAAIEYPDGELEKRGRCLAAIGLLPRGYDLEQGMIELLSEQAGAVYDQHSKTLIGISDLPAHLQTDQIQRMIVSHEVCHALQDRVIDIAATARATLSDMDGEYALRSVTEGMATLVMLAYCRDVPIDRAPDARTTMRVGFGKNLENPGMKALTESPVYLRESLISPYAEGGAFAEAWLEASTGTKIGAMLDRMPMTSEQVLHFDKYAKPDKPALINMSRVSSGLPPGWTFYTGNTLGEFDLRVLFSLYDETRRLGDDAAAGWDGLRFEAYTDSLDRLLLVGASAWDSEADAVEFSDALRKVLTAARDAEDFAAAEEGATVRFVVGAPTSEILQHALQALAEAEPVR